MRTLKLNYFSHYAHGTVRTVKAAWPTWTGEGNGREDEARSKIPDSSRMKKNHVNTCSSHTLLWLHKNPSQRSALSCRPCRSINK